MKSTLFMTICVAVACCLWTFVEGRRGCWADPNSPGDECLYGRMFQGRHDMQIRYLVTSEHSYICCEALECTYWRGCHFRKVGCGGSVKSFSFGTQSLYWELKDVEPIMRCYDARGGGAYYSYDAETYIS